MDILTIDFETYYTQQYSLSKLTTEEYLRHPDFEVIGVGVKKNTEPTVWFSGTKADVKKFLDGFDWSNSIALAHNAGFDMAILNWHFDIRPKRIADTLSMARALLGPGVSVSLGSLAARFDLGAKGTEVVAAIGLRRLDFPKEALARYGRYCCNDVDLTYSLWLIIAEGFPLNELRLIDLTLRMFTEPVLKLDQVKLRIHHTFVVTNKEALLNAAGIDRAEIMSNEKFADALRRQGIDPPKKISPTTGKETYAFAKTDEAFLELQNLNSLTVQALVAARLGVKSTLEETRTQRFIEMSGRGAFPVPLRYYAARTGRWGGADKINLQNLPRGSTLKECIIAPDGYVCCDSDSSQIEARTLAWLAGQGDLVDAFEAGDDVYKLMAATLYGIAVCDITPEQRFVGKTVVLGCGYGLGWRKFQAHMKKVGRTLDDSEAERIIRTYRMAYQMIPQLWKQADQALMAIKGNRWMTLGYGNALTVEGEKGIRLPNGLYIKYPNLRWEDMGPDQKPQFLYDDVKGRSAVTTKIYGGKVVENVCQALARIIIGEQMLQVSKKYKVWGTVHDAIGTLLPTAEEVTGREYVELCMRLRPSWAPDLPLNCEAGTGPSYGDC